MTAKPAETSGQPSGERGFIRYWTTLPGVLTGLAALLTAVVAVVGVVRSARDTPGSSTTAASTSAVSDGSVGGERVSVPPAATGAGRTDPVRPTVQPSGQVLATGSMSVRVGQFADLTVGLVASSNSLPTTEFTVDHDRDYSVRTIYGHSVALARGGSDRAACVAALSVPNDVDFLLSLDPVTPGSTICLLTKADHVAALHVTAVPTVGDPQLSFDYVLWQ